MYQTASPYCDWSLTRDRHIPIKAAADKLGKVLLLQSQVQVQVTELVDQRNDPLLAIGLGSQQGSVQALHIPLKPTLDRLQSEYMPGGMRSNLTT